jgi:hypothetical protein
MRAVRPAGDGMGRFVDASDAANALGQAKSKEARMHLHAEDGSALHRMQGGR